MLCFTRIILVFTGVNFRKFLREKNDFHGYFLGVFQFFFTGTFFFSRPKLQNSTEIFTGDFSFHAQKTKHCIKRTFYRKSQKKPSRKRLSGFLSLILSIKNPKNIENELCFVGKNEHANFVTKVKISPLEHVYQGSPPNTIFKKSHKLENILCFLS